MRAVEALRNNDDDGCDERVLFQLVALSKLALHMRCPLFQRVNPSVKRRRNGKTGDKTGSKNWKLSEDILQKQMPSAMN